MSDVKKEASYISISENFDVQSGFAFPSTAFEDSGVPIVRMSDLKDGKLKFENCKYVSLKWLVNASEFELRENDFLMGMSGSLSNYAIVCLDDLPALLNQRVCRLNNKNYRQNYDYVCYWLKSDFYKFYAEIQGEGAAQKNISSKQIGRFKYRAAAFYEQQKITEILQTIDRAIEHTEGLIDKYQQIKAGLMHDLFSRGIGSDGQLRLPRDQAPDLYQQTPIGWIPKEWSINTLSDLAAPWSGSTVIGPFGSDLVMSDYRPEGVPVIFVRDVKEEGFNWVSDVFVSQQKASKLYAHRVVAGDLLATKMGLPPCISAIYPNHMPMGIITADMIRMTVDLNKASPVWLSYAINHDRVMRQVAAITAGVTRPKITLADFRKLRIATPSIIEQNRQNSLLAQQIMLIKSEQERLKNLGKQKSGLMHDLLTGKVPVTADADTPEAAHV